MSVSQIWKKRLEIIKEITEWQKLAALALVLLGLIAIFFPATKRFFEIRLTGQDRFYTIGYILPPDLEGLHDSQFSHPAWNGKKTKVALQELLVVSGSIIYNETKQKLVGREGPGTQHVVLALLAPNACVYVKSIELKAFDRMANRQYPINGNLILNKKFTRNVSVDEDFVQKVKAEIQANFAGEISAGKFGLSVWIKATEVSC